MFEIIENQTTTGAKIKVIGVGGGGCNAVNTMIRSGLKGVDYIVANTDAQALNANLAPIKIQLGGNVTKGLGAGANPEVGRKAAIEDYDKLSEALAGADMVFITAGLGGGTGTGAAPVIAKLCREMGALTVGVVTKPFVFEGKKRTKQADLGIKELSENVDSLISIPNQRLLQLAGETLSLIDTFYKADQVLLNAVQGISDLINNTGLINADFADVSTVMKNKGLALMGTGLASGQDRALKAAKEAINSPLLEDITIDGATGIIINITGSNSLTTFETNAAVSLIMEAADEDAEIIFGTVIDENMNDEVKVTVIATGLQNNILNTTSTYQMKSPRPVSEVPQFTEERKEEIRKVVVSNELNNTVQDNKASFFQKENLETPSFLNKKTDEAVKNEARFDFNFENENSNQKSRFNLTKSIQEAASKYETESMNQTANHYVEPKEEVTPVAVSAPRETRVKSIAEKLGFMNFDDDEFDMPSYLKKDRNQPESHN